MQSHLTCKKVALHAHYRKISKLRISERWFYDIPSKNKFKTKKSTNLSWLASDINFKLLHTGSPYAHGITLKRKEISKKLKRIPYHSMTVPCRSFAQVKISA